MTDLTPVGLSKDGTTLVLVSARGAEFRVRVDHRLRSALHGEPARTGEVETTMESTLRPRDIQARIRAGDSAEEVATAAQTSVERIMPYAGPVLAERAHIAQTALAGSVRRRPGVGGGARTLGEAVLSSVREHGLHADDVRWDAWRREDGRWTLVADYDAAGTAHHATFCFDLRGRYVTAEDAEARVLVGEQAPPAPAAPGARRLAAVPSQDELPLGDDALEMLRGGDDPTLMPEREQRAPADADEPTVEVTLPRDEPEAVAEDTGAELPAEADAAADAGEAADAGQDPEPPARSARRKGRSSVPSWDEIMFGGGGRPD
ncbi:MAG: septation protein SepH [Marmoricola sp.]